MRTIGPTRPGRRTASSVTTWQPIEFATNAGHWSSAASSKSASAEARSAIPSGVVGCSLRPNPGKSGTKTEKEEASDRASGSM